VVHRRLIIVPGSLEAAHDTAVTNASDGPHHERPQQPMGRKFQHGPRPPVTSADIIKQRKSGETRPTPKENTADEHESSWSQLMQSAQPFSSLPEWKQREVNPRTEQQNHQWVPDKENNCHARNYQYQVHAETISLHLAQRKGLSSMTGFGRSHPPCSRIIRLPSIISY